MRASSPSGTRRNPVASDHANVEKLCITPLGVPVVPDVYMMVESSSPSRTGLACRGGVAATIASQLAKVLAGASGRAMQGSASGTPQRVVSQRVSYTHLALA